MIINTGSRTDIPAFFSEWFYNRIRDGYVMVRNPFNPQAVTRYRLDPRVVDVISFCTKNPAPMLPRIHELDAFRTFFMVTITPYGKDIEPFVPASEEVMRSFAALSSYAGRNAVSWRYDPVFLSEKYSVEFHKEAFARMAEVLQPYTDQCVVSFIDLYEKTKRNFPEARVVTKGQQEELISSFARTAAEYGMRIHLCLENASLVALGVPVVNDNIARVHAENTGVRRSEAEAPEKSADNNVSEMEAFAVSANANGNVAEIYSTNVDAEGCFSQSVLERAIGRRLIVPRMAPARAGCQCLLGADIGAYNTCGHGCRYCYANYDQKLVEENMRQHDPESPLLIGHLLETDIVHEAKQKSWIDEQMNLMDYMIPGAKNVF